RQRRKHRSRIGRRPREAAQARGHRRQAVLIDVRRVAELPELQPELMKLHRLDIRSEAAEGMQVALARKPVDEFDAELEGRLRLAYEVVLVDAEHPMERDEMRDRRFTHTDGADLLRLDQADARAGFSQRLRERSGGHPPRRATANDDDRTDAAIRHDRLHPNRSQQYPVARCWRGGSA